MRVVADPVPVTAGRPYIRQTIAACDAVRGRDEEVARVVLAEAFARELDRNRLERTEHDRPMLTVAEPKLPLIPFAHAWLKGIREYKPGRHRYSRSSQCYQARALAAQPLRVDAIALIEG
jgi:hypothetical protein